jgi:hypothetical protein
VLIHAPLQSRLLKHLKPHLLTKKQLLTLSCPFTQRKVLLLSLHTGNQDMRDLYSMINQSQDACLLTYLLTLRCSLFSLFKLARTPPNLPAHISTPLHMLQTSFSPPSHTMLHLHSHHSIHLSSPQSDPPTPRPLIPLARSTTTSKPKSKPKPLYLCQILPYRLYSTKTGPKRD